MMDEQVTPQKQCTGPCGQEYPATEGYFYRNKWHKDGLQSRCKICYAARDKIRRSKPEERERASANTARYRQEIQINNPKKWEEMKAQRKAYLNSPKIRDYNNRPEVREHRHASQKAYRSQPEAQESHRARARVHARNRVARKKEIKGTYTIEQIQDQLKRQKYKCYYCQKHFQKDKGKYIYHIEHTFPLSRVVGTDIPANSIDYIVLACPTCNLSKNDKFPWEWPEGGRLC